jgi:hypothetical protein
VHFCAQLQRGVHVRDDATLGQENSGVGLVHRDHRRRQLVAGESSMKRLRIENFVLRARLEGAANDAGLRLADIEAARDDQELLASLSLELAPELVGATQQWDIVRMLGVSEADDARRAMRGPELVRDVELLQSQHLRSAAREMVDGSTAHPAHAGDDDVVHSMHPLNPQPVPAPVLDAASIIAPPATSS